MMFKKKVTTVVFTSILSLTLASSAFAANQALTVSAAKGVVDSNGYITGQNMNGKFNLSTQANGEVYAHVMEYCDNAASKIVASDTRTYAGNTIMKVYMKSKCNYKIFINNIGSNAVAKAYLNNWYN
ncbi:hypothetical protein ACFC0X_14350 [Paenibacillus chitinolyticus]|uniref:hypothetical protein n=1 Tax=Paenibacillus chitinolyticus TaxID=79263 RepID=UPI0035DCCAC5